MKYSEFEKVMSPARMNRYLFACYGETLLDSSFPFAI